MWHSHCSRGDKRRVKNIHKVVSWCEKYCKGRVKWWRVTRWGGPTLQEVVGEGLWGAGDVCRDPWGRKENRLCIDPGRMLQAEQKQEWVSQASKSLACSTNRDARTEKLGQVWGAWRGRRLVCSYRNLWVLFQMEWEATRFFFCCVVVVFLTREWYDLIYIKYLSDCCGVECE